VPGALGPPLGLQLGSLSQSAPPVTRQNAQMEMFVKPSLAPTSLRFKNGRGWDQVLCKLG